ncbi:hypothetical protein [Ramlibacter sp. AN1133]|uniref:hypothetical protein n=1 Tax=Ramlibacter sp. AN1133 TaxID=3133429 RepID=UPI0030C56DC2
MIHKLIQARRLIEAFLALMLGQRVPVHWDQRASMDNQGGVHLPLPQTGDAAEIALLTRLAVHEGGHLLETQPGFADRLTTEELGVFNALEDPRMESRQVRRYPGASLVLSRGLDEMLQDIGDRLEAFLAQAPERALQLDLLLRGFLAVAPHGPIERRAPDLLQRLAPFINETQQGAIDEAVGCLPDLETSLETEEAARALIARLRQLEVPLQSEAPGDAPAGLDNRGPEPAGQQQAPDALKDCAEPGHQSTGGEGAASGSEAQDAAEDAWASELTGDADATSADSDPGGESASEGCGDPRACGGEDPVVEADGQPQASDGATTAGQGDQASATDSKRGDRRGADPAPTGASSGPQAGTQPMHAAAAAADVASPPQVGTERSTDARGAVGPVGDVHCASDASNPSTSAIGLSETAAEPLDLGTLLRETLVARYGVAQGSGPEPDGEPAADPLSDEELQQVATMLAQAHPSASLEELFEASLAALAAGPGDQSEDGSPVDGAGMSLASMSDAPVNAIETRLQGVESRLVTVLQRELQERRRRPTRATYSGGRVMSQRFWRLAALGDTRVFVAKRNACGIDAAATVLLDSSYSMREQLRTAAEAAMAFSLALQRLGVRTRVVRFPGVDTVTETLQRFGESPRPCLQRCATLVASGGTPIGAATVAELPLLLAQRRLKNILAIVTDDDPGDGDTLTRALACAEELRVLVVGVGIGCDIRAWIPNAVNVQGVGELPDALARLFRERISAQLAA